MPRNTIRIGTSGQREKLCTGPKHPVGGEYIPLKRFKIHKGRRRQGKPYSRCEDCEHYDELKNWTGHQGFIFIDAVIEGTDISVFSVFQELANRVGIGEASRLSSLSYHPFNAVLKKKQRRVRKETFAKALEALSKFRREGTRRHPRSIAHGARARGQNERPLDNDMSSEEWRNYNQRFTRRTKRSK